MPNVYLIVRAPDGTDVSQEIKLAKSKSSLMWSQHKVMHKGKHIGWLESGCAMDFTDGYTFEEVTERPKNWPSE